jgi:PPK2 family polyphosphate:nucleotide phosphotransferase
MSGTSLRDILRVSGGPVDLSAVDPAATPRAPGGRKRAAREMADQRGRLVALQEALYAEGTGVGATRRLLLVLQGIDTSGKDGTISHVIGMLNPQGCRITSFTVPTAEEGRHHFLWRIRRAVPPPGYLGIFNRSHYEDVLVVRVHGLVPPQVWGGRYAEINRFEQQLAADGVTLVKCFLHLSWEEQRRRLLDRLADPTKHWKFNPGDLDERDRWDGYTAAYQDALERCSTAAAPWYVIPSDRRWYRNWAVARLLTETLAELNPAYPAVDLDVPALQARLAAQESRPAGEPQPVRASSATG